MTVNHLLSRFLKSDVGKIILLLLVFMLTFCVILPFLCSDWVFSVFFQGPSNDMKYVKRAVVENDERLLRADNYFKTAAPLDTSEGEDVDVVIGVVSIDRSPAESRFMTGKLGYLTQVAAKLHQLVRDDPYMGKKKAFICNVDSAPNTHEEAVFLSRFISVHSKFGNGHYPDAHIDVFEKEKQDYIYCMREAHKFNPKFILIIEDDAIPHSNFFQVMEYILHSSVLHTANHDEDDSPNPWLFLKLYYPEKWQGYGNEEARILELIGISIFGGCLWFAALKAILPASRKNVCNVTVVNVIYFAYGALFSVLFAYSIGRQYVQKWRTVSPYLYHLVNAPDCCTQGILYPVHVVDDLVEHLESVRSTIDFSIDIAIDRYADSHHLARYLVEPNLMQHIGLVSTVRGYSKTAAEFIFT